MSYIYDPIYKKKGDKCPACYSNDFKKVKGTLEIKGKKWGLHCTVCKYSIIRRSSNPRGNLIRRKVVTQRLSIKDRRELQAKDNFIKSI